ncbi:MAG: glycosyl hydrolase family 28-related protein [Armatimonadota bacterium]|nr:glycosyl hydrolase family 28-related protein [Armatimonadota bacterium]
MCKPWVIGAVIVFVMAAAPVLGAKGAKAGDSVFNVKSFGAKADGNTDDTAAFQAAIDAAGKLGGKVFLPAGRYMTRGTFKVPPGVSIEGVANSPIYCEPLKGTIVLATAGRDKEESEPLFTLQESTSVIGLTIYYPEQKVEDIRPYPWTFKLIGADNTVEKVTLINSYNGIRTGPEGNVRHRIRGVYGCVLRRGIFVDGCVDVGRIEDIQFHGNWWWMPDAKGNSLIVNKYMLQNLEAFIFGKTDSEFVTNTFVFPAKIGYHFIATEKGVCYGQFSGISADWAQKCIVVDAVLSIGIVITNGMFASLAQDSVDPTQVVINETNSGSVRFENCMFWGEPIYNVISHGSGYVSLSNCYLSSWRKSDNPTPLILADNGKLQVIGCTFGTGQPSVALKPGLKHAVIMGNNGEKGVRIVNEIGEKAAIVGNEAAE